MRAPYTKIYVHCVWATWDRLPLLTPPVEAVVYACIQAKCRELKCELIAVGGDLDHVHAVVRLVPSVSVAGLVGAVKGATSHLVARHFGRGEFKWQGGYGAFSVSPKGLDKVVAYVQNQKQHHANRYLFGAWERCHEEVDESVSG